MVADAFGADSDVSKNLRGVEDYIAALYSAQSKKDSQEISRIMKDAEDKGVLANLVAAGKAFSVAPADLLANALGTAAPAIAVAIGTFLTGGTPLIAGAATLGTGAVMGAGTIKGAVYDATKEVLSEKTKLSPEQIEKIAVDAQSYKGENLDQILIGSLAGAFGARTGAELVIARQLAKGIATTVAQKEAVKLATEAAVVQAAKRGVVKQAAITGGADFLGEGFQGGQEQLAKNLALQRQGFDVPTMRGVVGQGALEGLAGLGMGTISGGMEARAAKNEVALQNAAKLTSQEEEELKDRFTTSGGDTKAADRAPTQQELDMLNTTTAAPPGSVIPPTPESPLAQALKVYVANIPEGKETEMVDKDEVKGLIAKMKELGLPAPKPDKTKGESTRVLAIQALRQYFGAGGEQLTDIPDLQGTTDGTQAAQAQQTETQKQETAPAADVAQTQAQTQTTPPLAQTLTQQQIAALTDDQLDDRFMDHEVFGKKDDVEYKFLVAESNKREAAKGQQAPAAEKPALVAIPMDEIDSETYKGALAKLIKKPDDMALLKRINSLERTHNMPLTGAAEPKGGVLSAADSSAAARARAAEAKERLAKLASENVTIAGKTSFEPRTNAPGKFWFWPGFSPKNLETAPGPFVRQQAPAKPEQQQQAKADEQPSEAYKYDPTLTQAENLKRSMISRSYKYDPDLTPAENYEYAIERGAKEARAVERKRRAEFETVDKKKAHKFKTSKEDIAAFETARTDHNTKAKEHNENRLAAIKALKDATDKTNAALNAEAEYKKSVGITEDVEPTDYATTRALKRLKGDKAKLTELANVVSKAIAEEEKANELVRSFNPEPLLFIPAWSSKEMGPLKDIYFREIRYGDYLREEEQPTKASLEAERGAPPPRDVSMFEHRRAAQAVVQALTDRSYKGLSIEEKRVANVYNETLTSMGREFKQTFPAWRDLTEKAKEAFIKGLNNEEGETVFAGLQIDRAFTKLAEYLNKEAANEIAADEARIREGNVKRFDEASTPEKPLKFETAQERVQRESAELRERLNKGYVPEVDIFTGEVTKPRFGSGANEVRSEDLNDYKKLEELIADGKLREALIHIGKMKSVSAFNKIIANAVASMVEGMKSPPLLVLTKKLSNNDKGQYDPSHTSYNNVHIGKISIRDASPTVLLHEAVHAVTVQVLYKYLNNPELLTPSQRAAAEQIFKIMVVTSDHVDEEGVRFRIKHPNAYESVFEFLAYAITDSEFQIELTDINLPAVSRMGFLLFNEVDGTGAADISNISKAPMSAWTALKLSIAELIVVGVRQVKTRINKARQKELKKEIETGSISEEEAAVSDYRYLNKQISLADFVRSKKRETEQGKYVHHNFLMELAAAFEDVMAPQTKAILLEQGDLSAKATPTPRQAQEPRGGGINDPDLRKTMKEQGLPEGGQATGVFKPLLTQDGWRNMAKLVQDRTYEARSYFKRQDMGDKIVRDMTKSFNNVTEHLDLSMGEMRNFLDHYLKTPLDSYKTAVSEYVKIAGKGLDEALVDLQLFGEMLHEPERRLMKFIVSVPLNNALNLIHNGKPISAAQRRLDIIGDMRTGKPGIVHQFKLTEAQRAALRAELIFLADNYGDPFGDSPRLSKAQMDAALKRHLAAVAANPSLALSTKKDIRLDINNSLYNALGITDSEVKLRQAQFNDNDIVSPERRAAAMKVFETMQKINKATAKLNKIGNYWSTPVDNLVGIYNYQYYMPFKGKAKHSEIDFSLDPNKMGKGKDMQEIEHESAGRFSVSDNPVLQVLSDAFRSARRAGVRNYTQSIKNALSADPKLNPGGTGILRGSVYKNIKFEDRGVANLQEFKGGQYIFHYNEDGSIDILKVTDPKLLQALRYSFKDSNIMWQLANNVTAFFGSMHTRYNLNFAPKNFLVDALTNAWNIGGGKLGPLKSAAYIKDIAYQVSKNGFGIALEVAIYHEKGDLASEKRLADMADKDPFVKAMLEMIQIGGKTIFVESFSLKANLEKLKSLKRNRILRTKDSIEAMLDSWNGMFELTSRTAAYMLYKESVYAKNKLTMSDVKGPNGKMSPAEQAACVEAAAETKNLANFEKAGEWSEQLGGLYMFIKPSSTGAVRAIETVAPAFTFEKWAKNNMPANIAADPAAAEKYMTAFKKLRTNSQLMTGTLIGAGYVVWWMSSLMAPDDEWERNSTQNDNMQQWTKYARFHIPNSVSEAMGMGKDVVFQLPWGFGLGAFMSMGAQIAGMAHGNTSLKDGIGNIVLGGLADSFLPLPVSKIPITDKPGLWLADSLLPSVARPYFEYFWNVNGIGQTINSASQRKFGDAFTGGDRIPEAWKDLTAYIYNETGGAWNISPNTAYFFANSYADGFTRLGEIAYSWVDIGAGEKAFNPKTDTPLLGSFFGTKSNVDARDFTAVEDKLKNFDERIKTLKVTSPEGYAKFITNNPTAETAVGIYYAQLGSLSQVREEANKIRVMPISQKDRQELLRANIFRQNIIKRQMIETFKALGVEP
jgi:hypothetical protein